MIFTRRLVPIVFVASFVVGFAVGCVGAPPTPCTQCDGACVDTQVDSRNCGACGTVCGDGKVCVAGACQTTCPSGEQVCSNKCVDVKSDRANCGGCGTTCSDGQICDMGSCVVSCASGRTDCSGACVDVQSDRANCGGCGTTCGAGQVCDMGSCVASCGAGRTDCSGSCVDLQTDPAHCGACTTSCSTTHTTGNACVAGACRPFGCAEGFGDCDGNPANGCETPTGEDLYQCGGCNVQCAPEHVVAPSESCVTADGGMLDDQVGPVGDAGLVALGDGGFCQTPEPVLDGGADAGALDAGCPADAGLSDGGCAPHPGPGAVCRASTCGYVACAAGFVDCDGNPANGCETASPPGGACLNPEHSWIFPGGSSASYGAARTVDFSIAAEGTATIYYTLDGTEPVPGAMGTVEAASPVSLPTRAAGTIRWFAKFADGSREPTQTQTFAVNAAAQNNWGIISENFVFSKSGSPVVYAAPGEALSATFRETAWRSTSTGYCPGCITQFTSGVESVGQTSCGSSGTQYPGAVTNRTITLNAPAAPGRYFVRFGLNFQFGCSTAGFGGAAMGVVVVR